MYGIARLPDASDKDRRAQLVNRRATLAGALALFRRQFSGAPDAARHQVVYYGSPTTWAQRGPAQRSIQWRGCYVAELIVEQHTIGRPATLANPERCNVWLSAQDKADFAAIGGGNISAGIRETLAYYRRTHGTAADLSDVI